MENAGKEISLKADKYDKIAVFAGLGNNGGDGLVAARQLSSIGKKVKVYSLKGERTKENQINHDIIEKLDYIDVEYVTDSSQCDEISKELTEYDCIIEALIGAGIRGELRQPVKGLVEALNHAKSHKIAVDLPAFGFKADLVLSFHLPKTQKAEVAQISIPREAELICGPGDVYLAAPARVQEKHKGDYGRVLVVGASREYIGAPVLTAYSALKSGADLSIIAAPSYALELMEKNPNLIYTKLDSKYYLDKSDVEKILELNFDSIVVGNGLGTEKQSADALKKLLKGTDKPIVFDADALKLLTPGVLKRYSRGNVILTPHRAEYETLFGVKPKDYDTLKDKAHETNTVILLKAPVDVISDGSQLKLNKTGNVGMTVGGTGDVLAGIIGALACNRNTTLFYAAAAGSFISGLAGDLCWEENKYYYTATDVMEKIPNAFIYCEKYY